MTDEAIVVLGIPIPSSSPIFLSIVALHVAAGLVCAVTGIGAMLAPKRTGRHPTAGGVYYWSLVVVFQSMAALSILRWPEDVHLFALGILSFGSAAIGRRARRQLLRGWLRLHVAGMTISYILLLTAFLCRQWTPSAAMAFAAPAGALASAQSRWRPFDDLGIATSSAHFESTRLLRRASHTHPSAFPSRQACAASAWAAARSPRWKFAPPRSK